mgnify:CR=1 FL=1
MNPVWLILASLAAVAVLAVGFAVQQIIAKRRSARRPLAPLCTTDDHPEIEVPAREVFSRDALINPNRTLNVHAWDNTPDSVRPTDLDGVFDDAAAEPSVIDRSFLTDRRRPGTSG